MDSHHGYRLGAVVLMLKQAWKMPTLSQLRVLSVQTYIVLSEYYKVDVKRHTMEYVPVRLTVMKGVDRKNKWSE
jgi:hypothetical protein